MSKIGKHPDSYIPIKEYLLKLLWRYVNIYLNGVLGRYETVGGIIKIAPQLRQQMQKLQEQWQEHGSSLDIMNLQLAETNDMRNGGVEVLYYEDYSWQNLYRADDPLLKTLQAHIKALETVDLLFLKALHIAYHGAYRAALLTSEQAVSMAPQNPHLLLFCELLRYKTNGCDDHLLKNLGQTPAEVYQNRPDVSGVFNLITSYYKLINGPDNRLAVNCKGCIKELPGDTVDLFSIFQQLKNWHKAPQLLAALQQARRLNPRQYALKYMEPLLLYHLGLYKAGHKSMCKLPFVNVFSSPDSYLEVAYVRARLFEKNNEAETAIYLLEQITSDTGLFENNGLHYRKSAFALINLYWETNNPGAALKVFATALEDMPVVPDILEYDYSKCEGDMLAAKSHYAKALEAYRRAASYRLTPQIIERLASVAPPDEANH